MIYDLNESLFVRQTYGLWSYHLDFIFIWYFYGAFTYFFESFKAPVNIHCNMEKSDQGIIQISPFSIEERMSHTGLEQLECK